MTSETVPFGSAYGLDNIVAQDALRHSAIVELDEALCALGSAWHHYEIDSLAENHANEEARRVFAREARHDFELTAVVYRLPAVYQERYRSIDFLKNWSLTLGVVGWKLAQAEASPLTNVAEELALNAIIQGALAHLELSEKDDAIAEEALRDLYEGAFEDTDFLELFDIGDSDDLPDMDPAGQMGLTDLRFKNWFLPFGSGADRGVPHPFLLH